MKNSVRRTYKKNPTVPVTSTINRGQIQRAYIKERPSGSHMLLTRCRCFVTQLEKKKKKSTFRVFCLILTTWLLLLNPTISRAGRTRCADARGGRAEYEEKASANPEGGGKEGRRGGRGAWIRQAHVKSVRDEPGCEWLD